MEARLDYNKAAPEGTAILRQLNAYLAKSSLDAKLRHLVFLRASQINGCAFCVDMHTSEALRDGEEARRLHSVVVWREAPFFTERERAALAWTEAVTLVAADHVPDAVYAEARRHFNDKEIADLTLAVATINAWNRLAISFRKLPPQ
ncbi:MAG TPA: carboxymuconolactone decarboxylase family protein [Stellaceae bacterium]|nr:carboxymuconolactone decarboxylase family protein [Stellaceae bacterium]